MNRTTRILTAATIAMCLNIGSSSSQTIYAVVWGHPQFVVGSSTLLSGLYRSSDMGRSWNHLGPQNLKSFSVDAVDSTRGRVLYIAAGNGIHRSIDSGVTWKIVTDWRMTEVLDVSVDQRDPRRVYAATAYGFWRSLDGGDTWQNPEGVLKNVFVRSLSDSFALRALTETEWSASRSFHAWLSLDGGNTWTSDGDSSKPPTDTIDAFAVYDQISVLAHNVAATWGNGIYRREAERWVQSGLEGSQVWRLKVTGY